MKTLHPSSQFKKDVKRIKNNPRKLEKLQEVLKMLATEVQLPEKYKSHMLTGNYKDCMECHIEGDFLLIWLDDEKQSIDLLRLGSHSELFEKGAKQ